MSQGAHFRSRSDTEVVLQGYRLLGAELWPKLRGMFALALWDSQRQLLWLARDAMGIKPLYYRYDGERLVFASELRALIAAEVTERRIDARALLGYLTWGSVPEPGTFLAGVQLLPPGHALRLRLGAPTPGARARVLPPELERFAADDLALASIAPKPPGSSAAARLSEALRETVAAHEQGDVPLGLLLSGGVDSSALGVLLRRVRAGKPLMAFTLASEFEGPSGEAQQAAETARLLGFSHQVCRVSSGEALAAAPRFLAALDQPSLDGFNTFLICERVRAAGYKLVLSGLGGDELFCGYKLHRSFATLWALRSLALRLTAADGREAAFSRSLYRRLRGLWPHLFLQTLLRPELRDRVSASARENDLDSDLSPGSSASGLREAFSEGLLRVQRLERQNYLVHTLLRDADVMSMAHGVELRVPFCDRALWSVVRSLGDAALAPQKRLLVDAVAHPRLWELSRLQKRGFVLPLSDWLRGPLGAALAARFRDAALVRAAGLHPPALARLLAVYEHSLLPLRRRLTYRIWALYVLLTYVEQHGLRVE
jgi:asparagine synthase (glutamine-hydrolysing)